MPLVNRSCNERRIGIVYEPSFLLPASSTPSPQYVATDEVSSRQCLQIVDLGFRENRGKIELDDCQTNKDVQLNKTRCLGFAMIQSLFRHWLHLYIGGEIERTSK
jgi:hypothetical protein